jgi:hypothetical protein
MKHWTEKAPEKYAYSISADVTEAVIARLAEMKRSRRWLAGRLRLTPGRVSQVLNNPGSASLPTLVRFARAVGLKVSLVAYRDGDPRNERGPVHSGVFERCWKEAGSPQDFWHWHKEEGS